MKKNALKISAIVFSIASVFQLQIANAQNNSEISAECIAAGEKVAAEQAGKLTSARDIIQNSRKFCVVVVIVPGREGERPRRVEVSVPAKQ